MLCYFGDKTISCGARWNGFATRRLYSLTLANRHSSMQMTEKQKIAHVNFRALFATWKETRG